MSGQNQNITKTPNLDSAQCRVGGRGGGVSKGGAPFPFAFQAGAYQPLACAGMICLALIEIAWCGESDICRGSGVISYAMLVEDGTVRGRITNHFELTIHGNRWGITTRPISRPGPLLSDSAVFDGEDIFRVTRFTKSGGDPSGGQPITLAYIYPGPVPPVDHSLIGYVWLAYASKVYFQGVNDSKCKPVWELNDEAVLFSSLTIPCTIQWRQSGRDADVLSFAAFMDDGNIYSLTKAATLASRPYPTPFNAGFTNTVLSTSEELLACGLPAHFRVTRYIPSFRSNRGRPLSEWLVITGSLTTCESASAIGEGVIAKPEISAGVEISDFRSMKAAMPVRVLSYQADGSEWPTPEMPAAVRAYRENLRPDNVRPEGDKISHGGRARAIQLALLGVTLLPVVFVIYHFALRKGRAC